MKNNSHLLIIGIILALSGLVLLFTITIPYVDGFQHRLFEITRPYYFNYLEWEINSLSSFPGTEHTYQYESNPEVKLASEIKSILEANEITAFPSPVIMLEEPPKLLVISPRDKIVYLQRVLLSQNLSMAEISFIEDAVDDLGVSSLVVQLGGFGAVYPPIVHDQLNSSSTIDIAVEEWFHQYLAFKPLGFRYLLDLIGFSQQPEMIVLNETFAGMVSKELGNQIKAEYYKSDQETSKLITNNYNDFDFDKEMRETRQLVDYYLSHGQILEAEYYMEQRRQHFVMNGYNIRKINQAYFAFHGIYGSSPSSISPIYGLLLQQRSESDSLKQFIEDISRLTSYQDFIELVNDGG